MLKSIKVDWLDKKYKLLDDSKKFRFTCDQCGKCCKNVEVVLNPYDVARISDYLKITPVEFVNDYCKLNIGPNSGLPILTLQTDPICKFIKAGLCTIYDARPPICRSLPVGRVQSIDKNTGGVEEKWVLNDNCSSIPLKLQKVWTIKEWIEDQKVRDCYDESNDWYKFTTEICEKKLVREDGMFRNLFVMICYMLGDVPREILEPIGGYPPSKEVKSLKDKVDNSLSLARWLFITTKEKKS
mgnify:CR=1 FL=1